jgi:hypothetical protein
MATDDGWPTALAAGDNEGMARRGVVGGYSSVTALTFGARIRQVNKRQESEENRCNSDEWPKS